MPARATLQIANAWCDITSLQAIHMCAKQCVPHFCPNALENLNAVAKRKQQKFSHSALDATCATISWHIVHLFPSMCAKQAL